MLILSTLADTCEAQGRNWLEVVHDGWLGLVWPGMLVASQSVCCGAGACAGTAAVPTTTSHQVSPPLTAANTHSVVPVLDKSKLATTQSCVSLESNKLACHNHKTCSDIGQ